MNLEELELKGDAWRLGMMQPYLQTFRVACDILFEGAFMLMPKLRKLELRDGFCPEA